MKYNISIEKTTNSKLSSVDFNNLPFGRVFSDHMFIADYTNGEWTNLSIEPLKHIPMHPSTTALHYGQAFFEGMKAQKDADGNVLMFRPEKNAERFQKSARRLAMPEVPVDLYISALEELLSVDRDWVPTTPGTSLYIRPFMFASDEYVGIKPSDNYKFIIFTSPVGAYYPKPVKVYVTDKYIRAFPGGVGNAKAAGNYAATLQPVNEIHKLGYDQILWLDGIKKEYLQEIGTMNVFVNIDGTYITPTTNDGTILEGVTRSSVIELLTSRGHVVKERDISINEVVEAHKNGTLLDAFGTGTAATLSHISDIGFNGVNMQLPPVEERTTSNEIKAELQAIKNGTVEDKFGWIHSVASVEVG